MSKHASVLLIFLDLDLAHPITGGEIVDTDVIRYALANIPDAEVYLGPNLPERIHRNRYLRRIAHNLGAVWRVVTTKQEIVITDHYYHSELIIAVVVARLLRKRVVVIVHHLIAGLRANRLLSWMERLSETWLLLLASHIITLSESSRQETQSLRIRASKITRIARPVQLIPDTEVMELKFRDFDETLRPLRLLFVGTCYERKGLVYLIEALQFLRQRVEQLDIIGKFDTQDPYFRQIQKTIDESGVESIVNFHGRLENDVLATYYLGADVFVLPSLWEGFGFVIQEAMAFGLPIVASAVGGILEQIVDGDSGILVPIQDSQAIAEAITYLFDHPAERKRMGKNGYNKSQAVREGLTFEEQLFAKVLELQESKQ